MCRLIVYKGRERRHAIVAADLVVTPTHSIIKQSFDCQERLVAGTVPPALNADGFGLGWYEAREDTHSSTSTAGSGAGSGAGAGAGSSEGHATTAAAIAAHKRFRRHITPGIFRSTSPAWNNDNLYRLSSKIRSPLIFCHVRAASPGSIVSEANCHPFAHGKYMWMHNGGLMQWNKIRRKAMAFISDAVLPALRGTTDSEHAFAIFLTILERRYDMHMDLTPAQLQEIVEATMNVIITWLDEVGSSGSMLNYAVTDGRHVIATKYAHGDGPAASLYFTSGSRWCEHPPGSGSFRVEQQDRREHVVLVASEPLDSISGDWLEVPRNSILRVSVDMNVRVSPFKHIRQAPDVLDVTARAVKRRRTAEDGTSETTAASAPSTAKSTARDSSAGSEGDVVPEVRHCLPQRISVEVELSDEEDEVPATSLVTQAAPLVASTA